MTNDAAVAWLVTNGGESCEPWLVWELSEVKALPSSCIADPLYSATTVAELRDNAAKWKSLHDAMVLVHDVQERRIGRMTAQLEAAERRVAEAESVCRAVLGTFQRNLASEEACGQPFMGDDEHEAIRLLTKFLTKETPLRQEKPE